VILKDGRLNLCDGGSCNSTKVILSLEVFKQVFHVSFKEIVLSEVFHGVVGEVREAPHGVLKHSSGFLLSILLY